MTLRNEANKILFFLFTGQMESKFVYSVCQRNLHLWGTQRRIKLLTLKMPFILKSSLLGFFSALSLHLSGLMNTYSAWKFVGIIQ
jgi:hypothetical protein